MRLPNASGRRCRAADSCRGFELYELVKVADGRAVVLMHFADAAAADEARAVIGSAVFDAVLAPNLARDPDRDMGDVVFAYP
jgi:hypothetical protein